MHQPRQHVPVFDAKVVMWAKDVGRHDRGEHAAVLQVIAAVDDVDHPLRIRIALIRVVRWPIVDHRLVDRVGRLVGKDARRQTRNHFLDAVPAARAQCLSSPLVSECCSGSRSLWWPAWRALGERSGCGSSKELLLGAMSLHRVRRAAAYSCERCSTLSLIATFSLQNSTLYFMLLKRPPTRAARWMTCVGLCFSKMALVCSLSRKSPSIDVRKIHVSAAFASRSMLALMPRPTRPEPPVTITTMLVGGGGGGVAMGAIR